MNKVIENRIETLAKLTNGSKQDIESLTSIEFERTPFSKTKQNYFYFIDNLKIDELNHMLNQFLLCKEG